jgi:hypothetical protein
MFLTLTLCFSILLSYDARLLRLWALGSWEFLVQCCYALQTCGALVRNSPLSEQNVGFLSYIAIDRVVSG